MSERFLRLRWRVDEYFAVSHFMTPYSLASVLTKAIGLSSLIAFVPSLLRFSATAYNFTKLLRFAPQNATLNQLFGWEFMFLVWAGLCAWLCLRKTEWVVTRILRIDHAAT
jgi:hypothetical protein